MAMQRALLLSPEQHLSVLVPLRAVLVPAEGVPVSVGEQKLSVHRLQKLGLQGTPGPPHPAGDRSGSNYVLIAFFQAVSWEPGSSEFMNK